MLPRQSFLLVCAVVFLSLPQAVWADARTDVMAAAARCAAIADARTWLNCYYGAAQPMRAQLGLPAAPGAQTRLVPPAMPGTPPVPPPQAPSSAEVAALPQSGALGSFLGGDSDYVPPQRITAYRFDKNNLFTVTLANGDQWRQIEQDSLTAHWQGPAQNYVVSVVPGMFGSHVLRVSDGHSYRVDKVKRKSK